VHKICNKDLQILESSEYKAILLVLGLIKVENSSLKNSPKKINFHVAYTQESAQHSQFNFPQQFLLLLVLQK
jgi:hypothetical protein